MGYLLILFFVIVFSIVLTISVFAFISDIRNYKIQNRKKVEIISSVEKGDIDGDIREIS